MASINADDVVDDELDELERRLERELQGGGGRLAGQEEDDGGASELIRLRELAEEVQGTHEEHGVRLRQVQDWLDEWAHAPAYDTGLASAMDDYRATLPEETRAQVEQAWTRMGAAVEELTAAVWGLRDYNEAVTEVWRQRLPAEWGIVPLRRRADGTTR